MAPIDRNTASGRRIFSGDIPQTIAQFSSYVEKNRARVMAVMAVRGVRSHEEILLGPDIRLVPIKSLPPSIQRGALLSQPFVQPYFESVPLVSALITEFEYGPLFFYREGRGAMLLVQHKRTSPTHSDLMRLGAYFRSSDCMPLTDRRGYSRQIG